jgi:tRNA A37 threonylcarbamoyltransferase TsaD
MDFPAGPYVEKAALCSSGKSYHRVKVNDGYFSLSGIENKITAMISNGESAEDVCSFTLNTVAYSVKTATEQLLQKRRLPVLVSGGVSVCSFIKNAFCDMEEVYFAQYGLGGDNALGAAILCARKEGQL